MTATEDIRAVVPEFAKSLSSWREGASGDWAEDNKLGRVRADELRANIKMTNNYPLLLRLTQMVAENGYFGGVEAGFFQRISELIAR